MSKMCRRCVVSKQRREVRISVVPALHLHSKNNKWQENGKAKYKNIIPADDGDTSKCAVELAMRSITRTSASLELVPVGSTFRMAKDVGVRLVYNSTHGTANRRP